MWVRAEQPARVFLALESADGSKVYAETRVGGHKAISGSGLASS